MTAQGQGEKPYLEKLYHEIEPRYYDRVYRSTDSNGLPRPRSFPSADPAAILAANYEVHPDHFPCRSGPDRYGLPARGAGDPCPSPLVHQLPRRSV